MLNEALQRNGIFKILAEPNLTAVTGQTASFLAGGEIPVPVPQSRDIVTVDYKPFGVSLTFTPTLLGQDRIRLHKRESTRPRSLNLWRVPLPLAVCGTTLCAGSNH